VGKTAPKRLIQSESGSKNHQNRLSLAGPAQAGEVGGDSEVFVTVESNGFRGLRCAGCCSSKSSRLQGSGGQDAFSPLCSVSVPGNRRGLAMTMQALGAVVGASSGLVSTSATLDATSLVCRSLEAHLPGCLQAPGEVQGPCLPGCPAARLPGPDNHSAPPEPCRQPDLHSGRSHGQEVVRRNGHRGKPDGPRLPGLPQPCARRRFGGLFAKHTPTLTLWEGLGVLQHLPLREIHLGVRAPNPAILWFAGTVRGDLVIFLGGGQTEEFVH